MGRRGIELLSQRDKLYSVIVQEFKESQEVRNATANPVESGDQHCVDATSTNVIQDALELLGPHRVLSRDTTKLIDARFPPVLTAGFLLVLDMGP